MSSVCFVIGFLPRITFSADRLLTLLLRLAWGNGNIFPLVITLSFFGVVWYFIRRWLGIYSVMPYDISSHFNQFSFIGGAAKSKRSILQVIWFATWKIWKEGNNRVFSDNKCSIQQVVDKIKSLTFMWLKEICQSSHQLPWLVA